MFKPTSFFIGLRYTRAKRRSFFVSFISLVSMLGIAFGVMVLITVLSVMNGFDEQIRNRVFGMAMQVGVGTFDNNLTDWQALDKRLQQMPEVEETAPYVANQVMLTAMGQVHPSMLFGIEPEREANVSVLDKSMVQGSVNALKPGSFGIVMGQELAASLGLMVGDKVTVVTPQGAVSPVGFIPRFKRFTVVGIFNVGKGFGFDNVYSFISMKDAQTLFQKGDAITAVRLKLKDLYQAPNVSQQLREMLPASYLISDWTEQYGAFLEAVSLEKTMMLIILSLIVLIAAFNLISSLVMVVNEKNADIAILRTIGAKPRTIMGIFMVQGMVIGIVGTILGLVLGIALALNVTTIVSALQDLLHVQLLSSSVYFVDYLPSRIEMGDVVTTCSIALVLSLVATIIPAWMGSKVRPVEALRYE
ncbi:MAG: lipoprotein-releasing system transmembrane subunit LolC [Legionellales bacterium]|nr:lipoprotein-releasing system transmembrane subunit LolC [Legionellales bacterium]|tara:strand:- start:46825 stop:48075 length:1251 start_codon:yes stop_codon:yes gene_type:complete